MFDRHRAEAVFAVVDGREVGFALYFFNFSTFIGHSGLYLEDLFVWPEYRGKGYGKALLLHLAAIALEKNCGRMEWTCLDWNQPSIDFYLSIGAKPMNDWTIYRLDPRTCGGEFNIKNNTASFADFPLRTASCPLESAPVDIEQE